MQCHRCKQREATVSINHGGDPATEHYCDECASVVMGTPLAAHRFGPLFAEVRVLRITFTSGDMLRLRDFDIVHPTIYGDADGWTATVVEPLRGKHPDFARLFHPDSGIDFNESDIAEILDESSATILFRSPTVA